MIFNLEFKKISQPLNRAILSEHSVHLYSIVYIVVGYIDLELATQPWERRLATGKQPLYPQLIQIQLWKHIRTRTGAAPVILHDDSFYFSKRTGNLMEYLVIKFWTKGNIYLGLARSLQITLSVRSSVCLSVCMYLCPYLCIPMWQLSCWEAYRSSEHS